jgi:ribosomal protein S20
MKTIYRSFILLFALTFTYDLSAQINMPQPSPGATVSQKIGLADVAVNYSRPGVKGRKIFGELVRFNELWRTGANAATRISFSDTVSVQGVKVPAGEYSLLTIPGASEWTVILNKDKNAGTQNYKQDQDQIRFKVPVQKAAMMVESFTIMFNDVTTTSSTLAMLWENTMVSFKIENEVDAKVMAQIKDRIEPNANVYYQSARYYYDTNKDNKQALEWITKSVEKDPKFYTMQLMAKIQARNKDYKAAIATAAKSTELAVKSNNADYPAENAKLVAEWEKLK